MAEEKKCPMEGCNCASPRGRNTAATTAGAPEPRRPRVRLRPRRLPLNRAEVATFSVCDTVLVADLS